YPERDSVVFKDKWGVKLKVSKGNILNFSGVTDADTNYIYAYRGDEKIGKLSVNTYKKKSYKVVLVRVNKATLPDINELEKYLGKVYRQSVDSIEIDTAYFYFPELLSFSHGGSPWNSVYNDDQKRVLRAYDKNMKDGVYYLFFIDNVTDKKDGNGTLVSGYMPRGYNAGFIYDKGSPHTIAHELGHGIAGLEHVFENSKSSGKTNNLMDYSSGEELWHFQWDEIQDPSRVWMKWNKDESEGEWFNAKEITDAIAKSYTIKYEGSLTFLTPAGYPITLPSTLSQVSFVSVVDDCPDGALTKFSVGNDTYVAHYIVNGKDDETKFMGYIHSPLKDKYFENDNTDNNPGNVILGYNYDCHIELLSMDYNKIIPAFAKIKKLGDGEVKLSNIPYEILGMNHLTTISDTEACFLKTDLAKAFYANEVSKIALHEKESIYNSKIHRISAEIDNFLLENPNAVLQLESFIDNILTNYNYLEDEWSVNDCSKLRKYLEYYVNSYTHKESLLLSSSIEDNKVIGLFGFNQSLDQILSEYSNSTKVEIICYLLKISCFIKNDNISLILNNIKKDDYAKFIDMIYVEDEDIIKSNVGDSKCLFDLVLTKFSDWELIPCFSDLMIKILEYNSKANEKFEVFKQFNDNTPYYAMTSFLAKERLKRFMSIEARKKLLKYYSLKFFEFSEEDAKVIGDIVFVGTSKDDIAEMLSILIDSNIREKILFGILSKFDEDKYLSIPLELRLNILKRFSNCFLTQAYVSSVDDEKIVVNLIKYIPDNDAKQLLDFLFCDNGQSKNYFENFKSGIDGDNYLFYLIALCEKWNFVHNSEIQKVQKNFTKYLDNYFIWSDVDLYEIDYSTSINDNRISITFTCHYPEIAGNEVIRMTYTEQSQKNYNYDEVIILKLRTIPDFFFSNISNADKLLQGGDIIIPAFLFQSIIDKTNIDTWINGIDLVITVASFVWGVGELKALHTLSKGQKIMAFVGLTMDGYSICTKNSKINKWVLEKFELVFKDNANRFKLIWESLINFNDIRNIFSIKAFNYKSLKSDLDEFKIGWAIFKQDYFINFRNSEEDEEIKKYIDNMIDELSYITELNLELENER
ncbi:MAG: hypothetical protein IKQ46_05250, partial [Bacteroidales bacterium]|nr:hypothetical protein [Bacteroidales bacterium]